ncbi:MAG: molecular chaperone HtpG [Rhodospirillaceae bacterium]|nr:molecular chaperone HtpG [Rhodospirillaceae bacterium]|tara:strand:- start:868 stop:2736 length:1869 start_codon:yes stop_codon:yes gene_type:complete
MSKTQKPDVFSFQAEVKQLLNLMINSLYSNKEIFLRELISNASDANDKLRFEALEKPELLENEKDLVISITLNSDDRTLTISDNGIGMSRDEIIEQLGTIAHSGTAKFIESLSGEAKQDSQLIGKFGVGFYSAFIVAEHVEVLTRRAGLKASDGVRWVSTGDGNYKVETVKKQGRGTVIKLTLKPEEIEFVDNLRVSTLIRKYSDHIGFPVRLKNTDEDNTNEPINKAKALWTRPRTEIADEEYIEFYKHIAHDFMDPLTWSHNKVEGKREYTGLLFVPASAPFDLWNRESPRGLKLYVQRVFITDEATQFLPLYLRFMRGVVDSSDLSLNVSRELLQQDPAVGAIRSALTKRSISILENLASSDSEKYQIFWKEFGTVIKEGLAEDPKNKEKIASLLRFNTTLSEGLEQDRSLEAYLDSATDTQDTIYYLTAESPIAAKNSPHLESLREKRIEVLLLSDRIDEWSMQHLTEFNGKKFKDVGRGDLDLDGDDNSKNIETKPTTEEKQILERVKNILGESVDKVRMSARLKESASCLVLGEQDLSFQMREMLKASGHDAPDTIPSLELNRKHPLVERLMGETEEIYVESLSWILFEQASLIEGRPLKDPVLFIQHLNGLILKE